MGVEGYGICKVDVEAWTRLVCSVYLLKHKTLFNSEAIATLTDDKIQLLKWLAYDKVDPFKTLSDWHDFTRRVCFYHSSGSKDHESLLIPTLSALRYHMLRSEYILKVVFASFDQHASIDPYQYGWNVVNSCISIVWDEEESIKSVQVNKGCSCKAAKCDGSTAGCRNCFRMCKPCTRKCKCKGNCKNPHNNGGKCPTCEVPEQSEEEDEGDEQPTEMIPLVPRTADELHCNTDSDDSDNDI